MFSDIVTLYRLSGMGDVERRNLGLLNDNESRIPYTLSQRESVLRSWVHLLLLEGDIHDKHSDHRFVLA